MFSNYSMRRAPANDDSLCSLGLESLETRNMLDGSWTLVLHETEFNDAGKVVSEVKEWDTDGDEIADLRKTKRYSYRDQTWIVTGEFTTDWGIDGTLESHLIYWRVESEYGLGMRIYSICDSDGDGDLDRLRSHTTTKLMDGRLTDVFEIKDLESGFVFNRRTSLLSPTEFGWKIESIRHEIDQNEDGSIDLIFRVMHNDNLRRIVELGELVMVISCVPVRNPSVNQVVGVPETIVISPTETKPIGNEGSFQLLSIAAGSLSEAEQTLANAAMALPSTGKSPTVELKKSEIIVPLKTLLPNLHLTSVNEDVAVADASPNISVANPIATGMAPSGTSSTSSSLARRGARA